MRRVGHLTLQRRAVLLLAVDLANLATQRRWQNKWVFVKSTLGDEMQSAFARFFDAPGQKAFAMAPDGAWGYQVGQLTSDDATEKARRVCEKHGVAGCRIILLNDDPAQ